MKTFKIQPYDYLGNPLPLRIVEAEAQEQAEEQVNDLYEKIFGGGERIKMDVTTSN